MALKIVDTNITTSYSWQNVANIANWQAVRNTNTDWQQHLKTTIVGETVTIEVEVSENDWLSIKENHSKWEKIKEKFASWLDIKIY